MRGSVEIAALGDMERCGEGYQKETVTKIAIHNCRKKLGKEL